MTQEKRDNRRKGKRRGGEFIISCKYMKPFQRVNADTLHPDKQKKDIIFYSSYVSNFKIPSVRSIKHWND